MQFLGIQLYRRRPRPPFSYRLRKTIELGLKSIIMMIIPVVPALIMVALWYFQFYSKGISFDENMENIVAAAWIPTFGLLYCLLSAVVFNTVWIEYKTIRTAVKRYDIETFVDLKDEDISPLIYTLIFICSLSIIGGFMSLKYHNPFWGGVVVGSTTYLLSLVFFVIREMDDPCGGFWFIKNIHPEWLKIDVRAWRNNRHEKPRKDLEIRIQQFQK